MTTAEVIRQCREALEMVTDAAKSYRSDILGHAKGAPGKLYPEYAHQPRWAGRDTSIAAGEAALRAIDEWEAGGDTAAAWQALAEERGEVLKSLLPGCEDLATRTTVQDITVCAACKARMRGVRNGDLYCETCKIYADESYDADRHLFIHQHAFSSWALAAVPLLEKHITTTPADALARRDERMKALGAAEWVEGNIDRTLSMGPHCIVTIRVPVFGLDAQEFMRREAAALRQKAGE